MIGGRTIHHVYLKLGYDADKLTKKSAIAIINERCGVMPELLSLEEIRGVNGKCNFRYYGELCYLKLERVTNYVEHGNCDGEENCILFASEWANKKEVKWGDRDSKLSIKK